LQPARLHGQRAFQADFFAGGKEAFERRVAQFFVGENGEYHGNANAVVGPTIDEEKVKEQSRGKSYGDIQSALEAIKGIENVDVKFSPFWVRTVPNDTKRINIEFKLNES